MHPNPGRAASPVSRLRLPTYPTITQGRRIRENFIITSPSSLRTYYVDRCSSKKGRTVLRKSVWKRMLKERKSLDKVSRQHEAKTRQGEQIQDYVHLDFTQDSVTLVHGNQFLHFVCHTIEEWLSDDLRWQPEGAWQISPCTSSHTTDYVRIQHSKVRFGEGLRFQVLLGNTEYEQLQHWVPTYVLRST